MLGVQRRGEATLGPRRGRSDDLPDRCARLAEFFLGCRERERETERVEEKNVAKERKRERGEDALSGWPGSNSVFIPRTSPGPS